MGIKFVQAAKYQLGFEDEGSLRSLIPLRTIPISYPASTKFIIKPRVKGMASDRIRGHIERLLQEVDDAVSKLDWLEVRDQTPGPTLTEASSS